FKTEIFSDTIKRIQSESKQLWRYQRFLLYQEYSKKTVLPPPLNTICYLFRTLRFVYRLCCPDKETFGSESNSNRHIAETGCLSCCKTVAFIAPLNTRPQNPTDNRINRMYTAISIDSARMNDYVETYQMRHEKEIAEEYWKKIIMSDEKKQKRSEKGHTKVENEVSKMNQIMEREKKQIHVSKKMEAIIKGVVNDQYKKLLEDKCDAQFIQRRPSVSNDELTENMITARTRERATT
ncbi:unnamed protein product, partial [Didymodactylos carnosus]